MRARLGLCCVLGLLGGCGFDLPSPGYVQETEIAAVRQVVVELGPLDPERVGPKFAYDDEMPIAEILPGDRLQLETVVIDTDGVALPADSIETLWLQCGTGPCSRPPDGFESQDFDVPCNTLAVLSMYTTDSYCLLGTGDARFEFEIPQIWDAILLDPRMSFYGVVAWNGRTAKDCWEERRGAKTSFQDCGFVYHNVTVGPLWWLMAYAESNGFNTPFDDMEFPVELLEQPANRIPRAPELTITVDGELVAEERPPLATIAAAPGAEIEIAMTFDLASQLLQGTFVPLETEKTYKFEPEVVLSRTLTTNAIHRLGPELPIVGDGRFQYRVDAEAPPGISRVLIGYRDTRGANDIVTVEFAVE